MAQRELNKKAIIVGAGFGGLAIAIRLKAMGFDVEVYEKSPQPGGHAYQFKEKGYTFDMGPAILTAPDEIRKLFVMCGERMEDHLDLHSLDPFYRVYYHDGTSLDYTGNSERMKNELAKFSIEDSNKYDDFMEYSKKLYALYTADQLGTKPFDSVVRVLEVLPKLVQLRALRSVFDAVEGYFTDFRSVFLFSLHSLFLGGSPLKTPALLLMLPYLEKLNGFWYATGGMYSVVKALESIFVKSGGKITYGSEVTSLNINRGKVYSVTLEGNKEVLCDLVISNAHFTHTYKDLIAPDKRKSWTDKKILNKDYSMSAFMLYLGVRKKYPQLLHHTLIMSKRYKGLFDDIFENLQLSDDFSVYLHAPTKTDSAMAPENCESMYLFVPVPNLGADIDWEKEKDTYAKKIIDFLELDFGLNDLKNNIEVIRMFTPLDFEKRRNSYLGAAWTLQPTITQLGRFRPHNKSEDVGNLYLVGASTHPGPGILGVLLSADTTQRIIQSDYKIR